MRSLLNKIKPKSEDVSTGVIVLLIGFIASIIHSYVLVFFKRDELWEVLQLFWTYKINIWIVLLLVIIGLIVIQKKRTTLLEKEFIYDLETLKIDREFFNLVRSKYITQEIMMALRSNEFASSSFEKYKLFAFLNIRRENDKSDFEFLIPEMERLKQDVFNGIEELLQVTGKIICGTVNPDWLGIPREWSLEDKEKASSEIEEVENRLCAKYDEFVRKGRRILKV